MSIVNVAACRISGSGPSRLSFAQSTASSTRSPTSAGSSRYSSSSGMNAYSPGSGACPARYMYASFPSMRSARVSASSEPSASPSGFSCVVTRNRSCDRSASATAARSVGGVVVWSELIDQLRHAYAMLDRRIVLERQLRRSFQPQLTRDVSLQDTMRRFQARERLLALAFRAEHTDEDRRVTEVRRGLDPRDRDEADAWI